MNASKIFFVMKALVLAVPFVLAQDLLRDLAHDLARTRELTHVYDLAYTSGRKNDPAEPE